MFEIIMFFIFVFIITFCSYKHTLIYNFVVVSGGEFNLVGNNRREGDQRIKIYYRILPLMIEKN